MSINHNPLHKSPERAFTLQKYLLLHSQHDALQSHLAAISASTPSSPTSSSPPTLSTLSPIRPSVPRRRSSLPSSLPSSFPSAPNSTRSTSTASSCSGSDEILEEERKLINVNQQIKNTLTELLNCESVRQDRLYSVWVQSRLMDAERELKEGRRHSVAAHRDESAAGGWDVNCAPLRV